MSGLKEITYSSEFVAELERKIECLKEENALIERRYTVLECQNHYLELYKEALNLAITNAIIVGVCDNCIFCNMGEHCSNVKVKWLLSEYKEPVKLIRVEHEILRYLYKRDYRYIAREESERVIAFKGRPHKITCGTWNTISDEKIGFLNLYDFSNLFQFTDWKDLESTSIEDVLKNCEVIDDDL